MTLRDAMKLGLLQTLDTDKGTIMVTPDGKFRVWYDRRRAMPWRWAELDVPRKQGGGYGGATTLERALRQRVRWIRARCGSRSA